MLAGLIDKGIGHIVAPDANIQGKEPRSDTVEKEEGLLTRILKVIAPDDKYYEEISHGRQEFLPELKAAEMSTPPQPAASVPPKEHFLPSIRGADGTIQHEIQCQHCKKLTPLRDTRDTNGNEERDDNGLKTPIQNHSIVSVPEAEEIDTDFFNKVMSANKGTAASSVSNAARTKRRYKVFSLCASNKPLNDKIYAQLRGMFEDDRSLLKERSYNMGQLSPDGFTPLMAAVNMNHKEAAKIVLELDKDAHLERDLMGRTPLHIAAYVGNTEMIELLINHEKPKERPIESFVDLNGRTPFGTAITSPNPKAKKNKAELEQSLYHQGDASIYGKPKRTSDREVSVGNLDLVYGLSDMPGRRVEMEDAAVASTWTDSKGNAYCILGVCDGHGDAGLVSDFVAQSVVTLIREQVVTLDEAINWKELWTSTCLQVDDMLKRTKITGGSTGTFAVITKDEIIAANVGDSRSILVQSNAMNRSDPIDRSETPDLVVEAERVSSEGGVETNRESGRDSDAAGQTAAGEDTASKPEEADTGCATVEASDEDNKKYKVKKVDNCVVFPLSEDHKADLKEEKDRIETAGMSVFAQTFEDEGKTITIHKVKKDDSNMLATSRAFGDFEYKKNKTLAPEEQAVIAVPDVCVLNRDGNKDLFLVLACDGIWDVMSNDEVGQFLLEHYDRMPRDGESGHLPEIGDSLLRECIDVRKAQDNLTLTIAALSRASENFGTSFKGKALTFSSPG